MSFHPELLNSYQDFQAYFNHSPAFDQVRDLKDEPYIRPSDDSLYMGRLKVVWIIVKTPFVYIAAIFLRAIALLLSGLQLKSASLAIKMLAIHTTRDNHHLSIQSAWGRRLMVPAINEPKLFSCDTYTRSPLSIADVKDERVRNLHISADFFSQGIHEGLKVFYQILRIKMRPDECHEFKRILLEKGVDGALNYLRGQHGVNPKTEEAISSLYVYVQKQEMDRAQYGANMVKFYREEGGCRGGSEWFATLFLMTQDAFAGKDVGAHLVAVAKQFENGYSSEAALLATFTKAQGMLGTKSNLPPHTARVKPQKHFQDHQMLLPYELDKNEPACLQKVRDLDKGIYCVGVPGHRLVYVKESAKEGYIWDPSAGLIDMSGDKQQKMVLDYLKQWYSKGNFSNKIYFEAMTLAPVVNDHEDVI